jgi:beta-xylosidase
MCRSLPVILLAASLLFACSAPATPAPVSPTDTAAPPPPATATLPPPTATLEPSPTPDPLLFRDDFDGTLDEAWQWIREKPNYWSLTKEPGWLRITARAGGIGDGTMTNLLVQPAPEGNFELETKLNFRPGGNFQIAGLLVYDSDDNHVALGRAFCDARACAGDGFYLDQISDGNFTSQNFATKAPDVDVVYLRLRREFKSYSGYASEDGQNWKLIGRHESGPMSPIFVGLMSGQAVNSVPRVAGFDYFTITALR